MTERHDHLRIRIPEKGELTLSMPDGVLRALRDQRLPSSAQVWDGDREEWVSLAGHPGILGLLQSISAHTTKVQERAVPKPRRISQPTFAGAIETRKAAPLPRQPRPGEGDVPGAIELIDMELPSTAELLGEAPDPLAILPGGLEDDGADIALSLMDITPAADSDEPPSTTAISPVESERAGRTSKETAAVTVLPVAASPEKVEPAYPLQVPKRGKKEPKPPPVVSVRRRRIPVAGVVVPLGLIVLGAAGFAWYRGTAASRGGSNSAVLAGAGPVAANPVVQAPPNLPVENSLEGGAIQSGDSAAVPDLPLQGVSGAGPEPDLETSIRLADAVTWVPAQDFGSAEGLLLARRKLEAVRNSIIAYRVDMHRLSDSAKTTADYRRRVEPFAEASRVDEVIDVLQSAVQRLDSLSGRFHVAGGSVTFDRPADASQWVALVHQADSLLAAPVELDAYPAFRRAPRRIVTRLVETLPKTR